MSNYVLNKTLVVVILIFFIGTTIIPTISGNYTKQDTISLTFYTFDKTGTKKCNVELSTDVVNIISDMFEELKYKITNDPTSSETKTLKNNFVQLLDSYDLIPQGLSKDYVFSLLNPRWLKQIGNNNPYSKDSILHSKDRNNVLPMQSSYTGTAVICSMTGGGKGLIFSPIMFPRPRLLTVWSAYSSADSTAANLITGRGFIASGGQTGIALGFWGIGLSFAFPGEPATFGFGGYAMFTLVRAEAIEIYPKNQKPVISEENPSDYNGSLLGYVNDSSGNPVEGALVRVYFHETYEEDYSDSTGYYHVTNIPICYCLKNATCSKNGYKTEWVLLGIAENTTHDFILTSNHPPDKPKITGRVLILSSKPYKYTFKAIDPDGDDLFYEIDWVDGTYEEWFGPYPSGEKITRNHTYYMLLSAEIGVRAKDTYGAIGEWGYLRVEFSRTQQMTNPLILKFIKQFPFLGVFLRAMNLLR